MNDRQVLTESTGFRPDLTHLMPLGLRGPDGRIRVIGTAAVREPRLHLVGYGDWTRLASATMIGVGLNARAAVGAIVADLDKRPSGSA